MDTMQNLRRTCYCGEVTEAGKTVVVGGFVQKVRNLGNLIFIDLRDRTLYSWRSTMKPTGKSLKRLPDATANMSCWQKGKSSHVPASTPI